MTDVFLEDPRRRKHVSLGLVPQLLLLAVQAGVADSDGTAGGLVSGPVRDLVVFGAVANYFAAAAAKKVLRDGTELAGRRQSHGQLFKAPSFNYRSKFDSVAMCEMRKYGGGTENSTVFASLSQRRVSEPWFLSPPRTRLSI